MRYGSLSALKLKRFFLQVKGDLSGAQDYYFRATLADPSDGEILVQYAQFLWEFSHDKDGAMSYFKKATAASPEDRYYAAAKFLFGV